MSLTRLGQVAANRLGQGLPTGGRPQGRGFVTLRNMLTAHPSSTKNANYVQDKLWLNTLKRINALPTAPEGQLFLNEAQKAYGEVITTNPEQTQKAAGSLAQKLEGKPESDLSYLQKNPLTPEQELDIALMRATHDERELLLNLRSAVNSGNFDKIPNAVLSFWHLGDQDGNPKNTPERMEAGYQKIAQQKAKTLEKVFNQFFSHDETPAAVVLKASLEAIQHSGNRAPLAQLKQDINDGLRNFLEAQTKPQTADTALLEEFHNRSKTPLIDVRAQSFDIDKDFLDTLKGAGINKNSVQDITEDDIEVISDVYATSAQRPKALETMLTQWRNPGAWDTTRISNFQNVDTVGHLVVFSKVAQKIIAHENGETVSEYQKFPKLSPLPEDLEAIQNFPKAFQEILDRGYHTHFDKVERFVSASDGRKYLGMTGNLIHVMESLYQTQKIAQRYNKENPDTPVNYKEGIGFGGSMMRDPKYYPVGTVQGTLMIANMTLGSFSPFMSILPKGASYENEYAALGDEQRSKLIAFGSYNSARTAALTTLPELDEGGNIIEETKVSLVNGVTVFNMAGVAEKASEALLQLTTEFNKSSRANKKSGEDKELTEHEKMLADTHPADPTARRAIQDEYIRTLQGVPFNIAEGISYEEISKFKYDSLIDLQLLQDNAYENLIATAFTADFDRAYHLAFGSDIPAPSLSQIMDTDIVSHEDIQDAYYNSETPEVAVQQYITRQAQKTLSVVKGNIYVILGDEAAQKFDAYARQDGATIGNVTDKIFREYGKNELHTQIADHLNTVHSEGGEVYEISQLFKKYSKEDIKNANFTPEDADQLKILAEQVKQAPDFMRQYLSFGDVK